MAGAVPIRHALLGLVLAVNGVAAASEPAYQVIVHPNNAVRELERTTIARFFLRLRVHPAWEFNRRRLT